MKDLPFYLLAFAIVLGVLIVVHELGHYWVARWCGVKVLRFSVGFGRVLLRRRWGPDQTEWVISAFPLGGYVKMLDEREGEVIPDERHRAFNTQSVGRRSAIVAAGPLANLLLAVVLYWGVFVVGTQELRPLLGRPPVGSAAARAGLANGMEVRAVDGESVQTWTDFRWLALKHGMANRHVELEVINAQQEISYLHLEVEPDPEKGWEGDTLDRLGLSFYRPEVPPLLGKIVNGGAGERAGLKAGDRVRLVDDRPIVVFHDMVMAVRHSPDRSLRFTVERDGGMVDLIVTPDGVEENGQRIGRIGVAVDDRGVIRQEIRTFVQYGFFEAGRRAIGETWDKSIFSLKMLGKMLTGEVSWRNLSGPVTIADYAGQSARMGLDAYLKFMALVSISLGVLNLLPIPVLDGGHLMYYLVEVVKRSPLSERAMEISQQVGLSILLVLMAFAFFNDLNRLFSG